MTSLARIITAFATFGALAAPAGANAQNYDPQPAYPQQGYPQPYPAYPQGYTGNNSVGQIIDQLLGNRYSVTDRQATRQCASAAIAQAQNEFRGHDRDHSRGYGYANNQRYAPREFRVTAITDVKRRSYGLRVSGLISEGYDRHAYRERDRADRDLNFRCNVDYRGIVTNVRISRDSNGRRY